MKLFLIISLWVSVGCSDLNFDESESKDIVVNTFSEDDSSVWKFKYLDEPNTYFIELSESVPNLATASLLLENTPVFTGSVEKFRLNRIILEPNEVYKISIFGTDNNVLFEASVKVPQDLVITSNKLLDDLKHSKEWIEYKAKRVFFDKVSADLGSKNLYVGADFVAFIDTTLRGYSMNSPSNGHGKNGPIVKIRSKEVIGTLNLFLNGQDGGSGEPQKKIPPPINTVAKKGDPAQFDWNRRVRNSQVRFQTREPILMYTGPVKICKKQPTDGSPGTKRGAKGFRGGNGFNGGDSGTFYLYVDKKNAFKMNSKKVAGKGGRPGAGGRGGLGQRGGVAGENPSVSLYYDEGHIPKKWKPILKGQVCKNAKSGGNAPSGETGDPGLSGNDGRVLDSCIMAFDSNECSEIGGTK